VPTWYGHAADVASRGLLETYRDGTYQFNHPPPIGILLSWFWQAAEATGTSFAAWLRLPTVLLDAGSAWLLIRILEDRPYRYLVAALYWLHPLALIFSAYHGNTDSAIAFFVLAAIWLVAREQALAAGAVLGLSIWVKLPGLLAAPSLLLALPSLRQRSLFAASAALVGLAPYLPLLLQDAERVVGSVFLYPGLRIQTTAGIPVWGVLAWLPRPLELSGAARELVLFYARHNTIVCLIPILVVAWCRRRERSAVGIAQNVALAYVILYGFTNFWAFQYLAWSLPLWLLVGWRFGLAGSLLAGAYIYGLYAWLCESWLLQGAWDFVGHPHWPWWLIGLRDATTLFFFVAATYTVAAALAAEIHRLRGQRREEGWGGGA